MCPYANANTNANANAISGSLHGPIGVTTNAKAAPFAIEQTGMLTFLHKV